MCSLPAAHLRLLGALPLGSLPNPCVFTFPRPNTGPAIFPELFFCHVFAPTPFSQKTEADLCQPLPSRGLLCLHCSSTVGRAELALTPEVRGAIAPPCHPPFYQYQTRILFRSRTWRFAQSLTWRGNTRHLATPNQWVAAGWRPLQRETRLTALPLTHRQRERLACLRMPFRHLIRYRSRL